MSPSRFNNIDELNYLIKLQDTQYFKRFIGSNRVSYKVAMFKAIEAGSETLVDIIRLYHPQVEDQDIELESLHAAFRGHLRIYQSLPLSEDIEEFNSYRENMFLCHGRLDKVNLLEINMHDLLSPNLIPVQVCDAIVTHPLCQRACLITGVLLVYCIRNHDNYSYLTNNPNIFIMDIMFRYAEYHRNDALKLFLLDQYKKTQQYANYNYKTRNSFNKSKRYNGNVDKFDIYFDSDIPLVARKDDAVEIHEKNINLSSLMFEWQYPKKLNEDEDEYFDKVISYVDRLLDQGIELQ